MTVKNCRFCQTELKHSFVDLGMSPLANSYVKPDEQHKKEVFYPLHAYVCGQCYLVQLEEFESPEKIFSDYAYFSSFSDSWLQHAKHFASRVSDRFHLNESSFVIEVASNDGYLLKNFNDMKIPALGIEPAANVAKVAMANGVTTWVHFFGEKTAKFVRSEKKPADLIIANNVLAHVPDINDFVTGFKRLLAANGVISVEFQHLLRLMENNQFDTIYHEHFSYLSLLTVQRIFAHHGLRVFDCENLPTHGGSLRVYATHQDNSQYGPTPALLDMLATEEHAKLNHLEAYRSFSEKAKATKRSLLKFFVDAKEKGKCIVGYGAPAKGNTLLNYCGIRTDFIDYTVDRNPEKQGCYLPGTRIPIFGPEKIAETKPDYVMILPWNLKDEITEQLSEIKNWGGQFVVPIPTIEVF